MPERQWYFRTASVARLNFNISIKRVFAELWTLWNTVAQCSNRNWDSVSCNLAFARGNTCQERRSLPTFFSYHVSVLSNSIHVRASKKDLPWTILRVKLIFRSPVFFTFDNEFGVQMSILIAVLWNKWCLWNLSFFVGFGSLLLALKFWEAFSVF